MSAVGDGEDRSGMMFGFAGSSTVGDGFGTGDVPSSVSEAGSWTNVSQPGFLQILFSFVFIAIRICFMVFDLYTSTCMYL